MSKSDIPGPEAGNGRIFDGQRPPRNIEYRGCVVSARRVAGPVAHELFLHARPDGDASDIHSQAKAIYQAIHDYLNALGADAVTIVNETVFHRDLDLGLATVRETRQRVLDGASGPANHSIVIDIEQPPLDERAWLEVQLQAVLPVDAPEIVTSVPRPQACECAECARSQGMTFFLGTQSRFVSGPLYGAGADAYAQTHDLFTAAEHMLQQAGMGFKDVVRTWIYLEKMERDYPQLNRARREFFDKHGIRPPPASTGIGASLVPDQHDICMTVLAIKDTGLMTRTLMTTPTLNEAPQYGADFSRGMRITERSRDTLYVSGTASLDETGQSVHEADFDAQADRMLLNVGALLKAQGADYSHIVSATTYIRNKEDAGRIRRKFEDAGYVGFPNALVEATVCRPELLCETEALAVTGSDSTPIRIKG